MLDVAALEDESSHNHEKTDTYADDGRQLDRDPAEDKEEQGHQAQQSAE